MGTRRLYPRLRAEHSRELLLSLEAAPDFDEARLQSELDEAGVFPPTGGNRITYGSLIELRAKVLEAVARAELSTSSEAAFKIEFDRNVGHALFDATQDSVGEFGHPLVWDFLTLVLLPDVASKRFTITSESVRYRGGNRRHVLQRLWRRWKVFDEQLITATKGLTEDDYVQLLERRLTSVKKNLANTVAARIIEQNLDDHRDYTRRLMRRITQISGLVAIDDSDGPQIGVLVDRAHILAVESMQ